MSKGGTKPNDLDEIVAYLQAQIAELLIRVKALEDRKYEEVNNEPTE